ncbi:DsbA family protein [Mitsuaria sp. GD03876]|uniref:DsbA family protein n=1 Tax=Mitsuaria sp. GD03876 TaxID=2975399 RepID=UPI00244C85E4|nr:DsbA family protein [Mitsuaria sp. GD03876]MDH0862968.1 DsbA family protein [Mitsuaria sp. GD03876]
MNKFSLPKKAVVYVTDAYCGWCWGFSARMGEFEAANRHRVPFTVVSGGLFVGSRAGAIANYPYIAEANERIALLTGAVFGPAYQALLEQGDMVMNSLDAGAALAALRAQAPDRAVHWAHELQAAFYGRGQSLSEASTIAAIAKAGGLDDALVRQQLADGSAQAAAKADFDLVRHQLHVSSYPTLLFIDGDKVHQLPATGAALDVLNRKLDELLADEVAM